MKLLTNRIVISLFVIVVAAFLWEFYAKPATGPIYIVALQEYHKGNYDRSLGHLNDAYLIDPNDTSVLTLLGWNYLKKGEFNEAEPYFSRALRLNPNLPEPRLGLAHCRVAKRDGETALMHFHALPAEYKDSNDVRLGMARAYKMVGENQAALSLLEAVYSQEPTNPLVAKELSAVVGSGSPGLITPEDRVPKPRPEELVVAARLRDGFFEVPDGENWKRIYVAGVNIGPATPGHFASEPPTDVATYLKWFSQIGALGANAVRVYTLLPPAFYHALLTYNERNPEVPIYLLQEIWLRDPPSANLFDAEFTAGFEQEIRDVVDVIHGQSDLPIQPGRAGGIFSADVSPYVLGWLVGREIEPHVVLATNVQNPRTRSFTGQHLRVRSGNASEVWLTQRCEFLLQYQVEKYNWQHPVSIVNWPPLDPLTHTSESRMVEEWRIRRERGERLPPLKPALYDDNDAVSVDEEKIEPQPALQSGFFATYHLYPFYPDFILHESSYRSASDSQGINSYWGYITDLKRHFRRTPVLVGEYGLSTSVGIAHFNPNGWNHGGMNEVEQGRALVRLSQNIRDAGYAGGIVFEWIDEWWKHNWIAFPFEKPFHRNALWHNDMDPEQSFGIQKFIPTSRPVYEQVFSVTGDAESPP
jgi:tetratricopeptide (TPR) repeat protein